MLGTNYSAVDVFETFKLLAPLVVVLLAFLLPVKKPAFRKFERNLAKLGNRRSLSIMVVGLLTFVLSAAYALLMGIPKPVIHDEFSYLLAADTFASGRLTNPTHPMWVFLESFHVLSHPTYASKYPPAQGLILALGQVLGGEPIIGVWLGVALACAATCWMLQAWMPARWALVGSLIMILRLGISNYWSQSYWGGGVAVIGGALLFGGLRRIIKKPTISSAVWMALGLTILANSRPFEGCLVSLPALIFLAIWLVSKYGPAWQVSLTRIILPMALVLGLTAVAMGYYNWVVTGNPLKMPYQLHEEQYAVAPIFFWSSMRDTITFNHERIRDMYQNYEIPNYQEGRSFTGFLGATWKKISILWSFFFGLILSIPLITTPWIFKNRWCQFALLVILIMFMGLFLEAKPLFVHYAAPATCLIYVIILQGMRYLHHFQWRGRAVGRMLNTGILLCCISIILVRMGLTIDILEPITFAAQRSSLISQLEKEPGLHLVIVRYSPKFTIHLDWVTNRADIDNAKIVWARDMGEKQNCQLLNYFNYRRIWLLNVSESNLPQLIPYPLQSCP